VGIAHGNGKMLDMTSPERPKESTWQTFYPHLTVKARANRALLYSLMIQAGFTNCYEEWWHYSYGDTAWAARAGKAFAIYGIPTNFAPALLQSIARAEKKPPRRPRL
jgi:D-alanyl-D-alanine dipeptidase